MSNKPKGKKGRRKLIQTKRVSIERGRERLQTNHKRKKTLRHKKMKKTTTKEKEMRIKY